MQLLQSFRKCPEDRQRADAAAKTASPTAIGTGGLSSPQSFASVAIGTASSNRIVVVCFQNRKPLGSANGDLATVTIGGVGATKATGTPSTNANATEIWYAPVPTGTTATISVTFSSGFLDGIQPMVGILTGSATTSNSSNQTAAGYPAASTNANTAAITVASGGVAVLCGIADSNSGVSSSWTNATKDVPPNDVGYLANGSGFTGTLAHASASATVTETVTGSGGVSGWVSASFQP